LGTDSLLTQGVTALLAQAVQQDLHNEQAWLWLGSAADTDEQRRQCLGRVLAINPGNKIAQRGVARRSGAGSLPSARAAVPVSTAAPPAARRGSGLWMIAAGVALLASLCVLAVVLAIPSQSEPANIPNLGPLYDVPYVVVDGRQSCSLTRKMPEGLDQHGIPYTFESVDGQQMKTKELIPRMKAAGVFESPFGLPVVDVNGELMIRPDVSTVVEKYNR
jgi:hypothetical protein